MYEEYWSLIYFFQSVVWVVSVVLSSSSLILPLVPIILLLNPSIELVILVIVVFSFKISIWFLQLLFLC